MLEHESASEKSDRSGCCRAPGREGERELARERHGEERGDPGRVPGARIAVQLRAQLGEAARESSLDRLDRHALTRGDRLRRELLPVPHVDRGAVGLAQRRHETEHFALQLGPLEDERVRLLDLRARRALLAIDSSRARPAGIPSEALRHGREPSPERPLRPRRLPQRHDPRVLHQVFREMRIADERPREPLQRSCIARDLFGIDPFVRGLHRLGEARRPEDRDTAGMRESSASLSNRG
jgi:hypothetical protein